MPCPHFSISICSRGSGGSAVAGSAYASGERLYCEYDHHTKFYPDKEEQVVYKEVLLPTNAPEEFKDRQTLWNSVEAAEPNWNSQLARKIILALPKELSDEDNRKLLREYLEDQFVSKGMIADYAIHRTKENPDNIHAHVMLTMRKLDEQGKWMPKSRKEYILDKDGNRVPGKNGKPKTRKIFTTDWDDKGNAEKWRKEWETIQNRYLEKAGVKERISMDSFEKQGSDMVPQVHKGAAVCALEKKGVKTHIGDLSRAIEELNKLIRSVKEAIRKLDEWIKEIKAGAEQIEIEPREISLYQLCRIRFDEREKERKNWPHPYSVRKASFTDARKAIEIYSYIDVHNLRTIEDLEKRLAELSDSSGKLYNEKRSLSRRVSKHETTIQYLERKKELDPVYKKANRPGFGKKKYREEHAAELEERNNVNKYLKTNHIDEADVKSLKLEYENLKFDLEKTARTLEEVKKEMRVMKGIKYLIKDLLPELIPEKEMPTEEVKEQKRQSIYEKLEKKKEEVKQRESEKHNFEDIKLHRRKIER